jgi:hypothetical protein
MDYTGVAVVFDVIGAKEQVAVLNLRGGTGQLHDVVVNDLGLEGEIPFPETERLARHRRRGLRLRGNLLAGGGDLPV